MSAEKKHTILVVPGFRIDDGQLKYLAEQTEKWQHRGLSSEVLSVVWEEGSFSAKKSEVHTHIKEKLQKEHRVSILGVSAGGSLAVAGLIEEPNVSKVVTISSRLRSKQVPGYPTLEHVGVISPSAADAVRWLEDHDSELTNGMRAKILNTRACAGDMQVHPSMSFIQGAENIFMPPSRNHVNAVSSALTKNSDVIVDFLLR